MLIDKRTALHGEDPELRNRLFFAARNLAIEALLLRLENRCCGKVSRCDANETKRRLGVLASLFNCHCVPRRTRKTTIPTICGWCAACGLRARRFRHRMICPPVFIRWAGPWCMKLGVDGNPRSWWHFNAWFRNGRTRGLGRRNHQGELSLRLRSAQFVLIEFV